MVNILLEYVIVFLLIFIFHYFMLVTNKKDKKKGSKKNIPTELLYLQKVYHVNIKEIDYNEFGVIYSLVNTFIISTIYMILMYLLDNLILRVVVGVVLLILMIIICYGFLARYYLKKEGR